MLYGDIIASFGLFRKPLRPFVDKVKNLFNIKAGAATLKKL
jgi:hypothetical protein